MCISFSFGSTTASEKEGVRVEKYLYEALPVAGDASRKERVQIQIHHIAEKISYYESVSSSKSTEEITIETDKGGQFVSATRRSLAYDKGLSEQERIWKDKDKVFTQGNGGSRLNTYNIPTDRRFAVDGSLLILLRFFPFETDETWKVFMVDFTGYAITVEVQRSGEEIITVPAGTFDCYRVEVVVGIPILRPKIVYWLTRDTPHYLVKNVGRRGPFTDSYVTTLISRELDDFKGEQSLSVYPVEHEGSAGR